MWAGAIEIAMSAMGIWLPNKPECRKENKGPLAKLVPLLISYNNFSQDLWAVDYSKLKNENLAWLAPRLWHAPSATVVAFISVICR